MQGIFGSAIASGGRFIGLAMHQSLHMNRSRIGKIYHVHGRGDFAIFRETYCNKRQKSNERVTLIVGFRLKLIRDSNIMHWLFQRVCILTTPFWSGFDGFRVKLWMFNPENNNYLGIYDWRGRPKAQRYVDTLVRVLRPLSTENSVWYDLLDQNLEGYLRSAETGAQ